MWLPSVIEWIPCFADLNLVRNVTYECANLTVPIDYLATSGNLTTQIGIAKARPVGITQPSGILFYQRGEASPNIDSVNGIGVLLNMTNHEYDIVMMDPRGSGWSTPITCGNNLSLFTPSNDALGQLYDSDMLPLSFEFMSQVVGNGSLMGIICTQTEDLRYAAHINAPNIARDMDLIRNLSGFDTLAYYGDDYGTVIGITYASLFPNRVGRMVLDWVRDYEAWIGVNGNFLDYNFEMNSNIDDIFLQFANFCVAAYEINSQYCPLAGPSMNSQDPATDIVNRIYAIFDDLSKIPRGVYIPEYNGTYSFLTEEMEVAPIAGWVFAAQGNAQNFLYLESAIQKVRSSSQMKRQVSSSSNLSFASLNQAWLDDTYYYDNLATQFIDCADSNFIGINDTDSYVNYASKLINDNLITGYQGIVYFTEDIPCPNLTSYNPERLPTQFPPAVHNRIIIIAQTHNMGFPMKAAMNTYNFVGPDNAVVFVHDAFGYDELAINDLDECTMSVMKEYFANGRVPENGTICHMDYSGMNNIFIKYYHGTIDQEGGKRRIGLGIGSAFLGLIIVIVSTGYWNLRRKRRAKMAHVSKVVKLDGIELNTYSSLKKGK